MSHALLFFEKPLWGMLCRSCGWWSFSLGREMCGEPAGPAQNLRLGLISTTMILLLVSKMPLISYQMQVWRTPLSWKLSAALLYMMYIYI